MPEVTIYVSGGVVQYVEKSHDDTYVEVFDYDTDKFSDEELKDTDTDENGFHFIRAIW